MDPELPELLPLPPSPYTYSIARRVTRERNGKNGNGKKENGKKGNLFLKGVHFLKKLHFLRILLQIKQPAIQGIFLFLYKESWRKQSLDRPLKTCPGDEVEKINILEYKKNT